MGGGCCSTNGNDPRINTNLHFAERGDGLTFSYKGEIKGVNTAALEGVPSLDRQGILFFVSTRSYTETLSTLHRGRWNDGDVSGVELAAGVSQRQPGMVTFDAEIAGDGKTLFIVDGRFTGGQVPETADIAIAIRDGASFHRLPPDSDTLLRVPNHRGRAGVAGTPRFLDRAARRVFFTLVRVGGQPTTAILRSARESADACSGRWSSTHRSGFRRWGWRCRPTALSLLLPPKREAAVSTGRCITPSRDLC